MVYVELPQVGQVIEAGQAMGQVSSRTTPPR
nr:hypothetical protein [Streptomyces sp. CZ24]